MLGIPLGRQNLPQWPRERLPHPQSVIGRERAMPLPLPPTEPKAA